jgi:type 1 glutamine amidotransferase
MTLLSSILHAEVGRSMKTRNMSKMRLMCVATLAAILLAPVAAQEQAPLRVFIRSSHKTHGPGLHDYPAFLTDWKKLLAERGAVVDGAQRFPTADELAKTDVMVIYASDGGFVSPEERAVLEPYLKRGGGLATIHDGMCSNDASWFATIVGAAKQHGEVNFSAGPVKLHFVDGTHPITQGLSDFEIDDEAFFLLRTAPEMHVLATAPLPSTHAGEIVPQLWAYEKTLPGGQPYRSFVSMQGHAYTNFAVPAYRNLLLRGIAWAGKRPVDLLTRSTH